MRTSNLPYRDILMQVFSKAFVYLLSGLVDGPYGYPCSCVVQVDLVILEIVFRKSSCLLVGKELCLIIVSFTCVND